MKPKLFDRMYIYALSFCSHLNRLTIELESKIKHYEINLKEKTQGLPQCFNHVLTN